jgi:hypothetical protein
LNSVGSSVRDSVRNSVYQKLKSYDFTRKD